MKFGLELKELNQKIEKISNFGFLQRNPPSFGIENAARTQNRLLKIFSISLGIMTKKKSLKNLSPDFLISYLLSPIFHKILEIDEIYLLHRLLFANF